VPPTIKLTFFLSATSYSPFYLSNPVKYLVFSLAEYNLWTRLSNPSLTIHMSDYAADSLDANKTFAVANQTTPNITGITLRNLTANTATLTITSNFDTDFWYCLRPFSTSRADLATLASSSSCWQSRTQNYKQQVSLRHLASQTSFTVYSYC
jgi:hypothetical protein